jgi:hypothetical protein
VEGFIIDKKPKMSFLELVGHLLEENEFVKDHIAASS